MDLRQRLEREIRAAIQAAGAHSGSRVNVARRVNRVIVANVGESGTAAASAEQSAPIIQDPEVPEDQPRRS
jgi:hypothetical protein